MGAGKSNRGRQRKCQGMSAGWQRVAGEEGQFWRVFGRGDDIAGAGLFFDGGGGRGVDLWRSGLPAQDGCRRGDLLLPGFVGMLFYLRRSVGNCKEHCDYAGFPGGERAALGPEG